MTTEDFKNKIEWFLGITAKLCRPYLKRKYYPPKDEDWLDKYIGTLLIYLSTWILVGVVYISFVYLFVYVSPEGRTGSISDFWQRSPKDIILDVFNFAKVSVYFNLTFLLAMYFAIINHAEKTFLKGSHLHLELAGLIKAIKLGQYDRSSHIKEQSEDQVGIARKNILSVADNSDFSSLSILTASGWDFFGSGHPLTNKPLLATPAQAPTTPSTSSAPAPSNNPKPSWWKKLVSSTPIQNGYLLPVIREQSKRVRIILLDPNSAACRQRAKDYLGAGKHQVIKSEDEYKKSIEDVIANLKLEHRKNKNIELKLVQNIPQWKIVISNNEAWVQPVNPGIRSDHAPLYGFKKGDYSMYHTFWNIHEALWHAPDSRSVDLSK